MMQAVNAFAPQVKKCEAAIRSAHSSNLELLTSTQGVMVVPLPQAYQGVASGTAATPTTATLDLVGGDVHGVSRAGNEASHKLETEVLAPLVRWQQVHRQLQVRLVGGVDGCGCEAGWGRAAGQGGGAGGVGAPAASQPPPT